MKTTLELPDDLFIAAKKKAAESRTTLRSLVERGSSASWLGVGPAERPGNAAARPSVG